MAHFAQLDENNVVTQVIVIHNNELLDNGVESEAKGIAFCQSLYGTDTRWVQTSYNNTFRKRFAGIGFAYNSLLNAFVPPKPEQYPSWVLSEEIIDWIPPIPRPTDTVYYWDEETVSWIASLKPYPSWVPNETSTKWMAPVPFPQDGKKYRWNEPTLSWVEVVDL